MSVCHHLEAGIRQRDVRGASYRRHYLLGSGLGYHGDCDTHLSREGLLVGGWAAVHSQVAKTPQSPDRTSRGAGAAVALTLPRVCQRCQGLSRAGGGGGRGGGRCPSRDSVRQALCTSPSPPSGRRTLLQPTHPLPFPFRPLSAFFSPPCVSLRTHKGEEKPKGPT